MRVSPELLSRFVGRRTIGLYVADRAVTVTQAALTPAGPVELASETAAYDSDEELAGSVQRMLGPFLGKRGRDRARLRVGLGVPASRVFFCSRPGQGAEREVNPAVVLHEALRTTDLNVDEMLVDLLRTQPGKRTLLSLVACRRKYLVNLMQPLKAAGVRPFRAEPAPFALLRLGAWRQPAPRKVSTVLRFFLGEGEGVALLLYQGTPLAWRTFGLPAGGENAALLSTAMALRVVGRQRGESDRSDAVIVHGRPDLAGTLRAELFQAVVGSRPLFVPGPAHDDRTIALGLAAGCRETEHDFDLSRTVKERPPVWEVLPLGQVAAQVAILAGLTWVLDDHQSKTEAAVRIVQADCSAHTWMKKVADDQLKREKTELEQKIATVRTFLETRVSWSTYTHGAASGLSPSMVLRSFTGTNEFGAAGSKGPKKSLLLGISAPIPQGQTIPREIDAYLGRLRSDRVLKHDFPQVELDGLRWAKGGGSGPSSSAAQANFVVKCMPRSDKAAGKGAARPKSG